jgi:hypothetical protein
MVVVAGLAMLVIQPNVVLLAEPAEPSLQSEAVDDRLEATLLRVNPRLGTVTTSRIRSAVERCSDQQGLRAELVLAVILVESSARPHVRSSAGAVGLMQVMPHMFRQLGLPGNVAHLEANIEAGCLLLADNIRRLGEEDGISTYFWGRRIRGDDYLRRVQAVLEELEEPPSPRPQHG